MKKMGEIRKSSGVSRTERLLTALAEKSFLNLWCYANPYKDDNHELCDLIVVFEKTVLLFFDRESEILEKADTDPDILWNRWKRKVVDRQIKTARGAERYIKSGRKIFLDATCKKPFPLKVDERNCRIYKFIVANGAHDLCKTAHPDNISGSLAIEYSDDPNDKNIPFVISLDRSDPIHVLDSENAKIIFSELDTITDFIDFYSEKETAIRTVKSVFYCAEEDLIAYYFRNFNAQKNKHYFRVKHRGKILDGIALGEGFWESFKDNPSYKRKKTADRQSYFWDSLIQKTGKNILAQKTMGNADVFSGNSAIHEMAKESRFSRRNLSKRILTAVEQFPQPPAGENARYLTFFQSEHDKKGYVFLQLFLLDREKEHYENEYAPKRRTLLEIACGAAKNKFPELTTVIGIGVDAPKFYSHFSEDFLLLKCETWSDEQRAYYENLNLSWNFFATDHLKMGRESTGQFPSLPGRNDPCYCGSGIKYKRCHGSVEERRRKRRAG